MSSSSMRSWSNSSNSIRHLSLITSFISSLRDSTTSSPLCRTISVCDPRWSSFTLAFVSWSCSIIRYALSLLGGAASLIRLAISLAAAGVVSFSKHSTLAFRPSLVRLQSLMAIPCRCVDSSCCRRRVPLSFWYCASCVCIRWRSCWRREMYWSRRLIWCSRVSRWARSTSSIPPPRAPLGPFSEASLWPPVRGGVASFRRAEAEARMARGEASAEGFLGEAACGSRLLKKERSCGGTSEDAEGPPKKEDRSCEDVDAADGFAALFSDPFGGGFEKNGGRKPEEGRCCC
mmetsp:Transcript_21059/g.45078  ORF Transcript_21059/g.45078 Transcript_21059/m.45078 type:complete len:289 (-) Transcript_21059:441-1307(-)